MTAIKIVAAAALLLLASVLDSVVAVTLDATPVVKTLRQEPLQRLVQNARRLSEDEDDEDDEEQDAYAFLQDYKVKFLSCKAGEKMKGGGDDGGYEYSAVVFRLCPADGECDGEEGSSGCDSGFGDMVVGINTFVDAYFEMNKDDMEEDEDFRLDEYADCREYEQEEEGDDEEDRRRRRLEENKAGPFYIGPACTEDESNIKLGWFSDDTCETPEEKYTFYEISDGGEIPYEDGGLISSSCTKCSEKNDDGEYEVNEFCMQLYESSGHCETNMQSMSDYGIDEEACEYITQLMPAQKRGGRVGKFFLWLLFIVIVVAVAFFIMQQRKKSTAGKTSTVDKTGLMA